MMERIECLVVGGGAVGLGIGRALAVAGRQVIVLEANPWLGNETSSRNNEVIHAGFLYQPGSLRARLFPRAREALYAYCAAHGVDAVNTGKLIFAVCDEDLDDLETLRRYADEAGIDGVEMIGANAVRALEPELRCIAALHSSRSGMIDSHGLLLAYRGEIEDNGGAIAVNSRARGGRVSGAGFEVDVEIDGEIGGDEVYTLACDVLVNAAGLGAQTFAHGLDGFDRDRVPDLYLGKGCFFSLTGRAPFSRPISPVGNTLEMGATFTIDLAGRAKFGPDLELIESKDYSVDPARRTHFAAAIRRYWPGLDESRLQPDYAGIRPMLRPERNIQLDDWVVDGPQQHGHAGLVHLFGISTPGLTGSLALGEYVRSLVE